MRSAIKSACSYLAAPQSLYAECIRSLRASVLHLARQDFRCILITSAWANEGKTTTSINLAACYAELGKSVLLIDADLRKRTLTKSLQCDGPGLAQVGQDEPGLITDCGVAGVCVAPSGDCSACIYDDLLASPALSNWVKKQRKSFDLILVDSPPLTVSKDALLLGKICDGALLVSSAAKFRGLPEGHFSEDLRDAGVTILGIVSISKETALRTRHYGRGQSRTAEDI